MLRRNFLLTFAAGLAASVSWAKAKETQTIPGACELQSQKVRLSDRLLAAKIPTLSPSERQVQRLNELWKQGHVMRACPWLAPYQVDFKVQSARYEAVLCIACFKIGEHEVHRPLYFKDEVLQAYAPFYLAQRDTFISLSEVRRLVVEHQRTKVRENVRA
jgi:hypothetical protein